MENKQEKDETIAGVSISVDSLSFLGYAIVFFCIFSTIRAIARHHQTLKVLEQRYKETYALILAHAMRGLGIGINENSHFFGINYKDIEDMYYKEKEQEGEQG